MYPTDSRRNAACSDAAPPDPRDAFVSPHYATLDGLPQGARVGTSSLRRQCQLKAARPDLQILLLRGNVETRLRKLDEGHYDAIILASAGLIRLDLAHRITHPIDCERSLPAVGQAIVGIECRSEDQQTIELVSVLNDMEAWTCCDAERAFALRLQGSCQSPIGGFAELAGGELQLAWRCRVGGRQGDVPRQRVRTGGRLRRSSVCNWPIACCMPAPVHCWRNNARRPHDSVCCAAPAWISVLVTRPARQRPACRSHSASGRQAISFPAIEIEPLAVAAQGTYIS